MKTYDFCTDACSGEVTADSLQAALDTVVKDERIGKRQIADGAFAWVEDAETGERLSLCPENEF